MSNNIIVLPGTRWQIPLVQKLKRRGFYVIVLDYYENQPAYRYGDKYEIVNILDKQRVLEIAKQYDALAVMSDECDIATPTVAWVSQQLKKPTIGSEMAELYTNKYKMRQFAKKNGFAVPEFYKCASIEETIAAFKKCGKKMIMKPLDANSSRGVYSIKNESDITRHYSETVSYSKLESSILLEEYVQGEEFSIDAIKIKDKVYSMAISRKGHFIYNENLDRELTFEYKNSQYDFEVLRTINQEYIKKTGLAFGLTHAEYKYCNGQYYMIEIGARGGGNLISSIINPYVTGIDSQEILIDWAIGQQLKEEDIKYAHNYQKRCATLYFFDTEGQEGVLEKIKGQEMLETSEAVKSYYFFKKEGQPVGRAKDGGTRLGYCIVCCESKQELDRVNHQIRKKVQLIIK